MNNEKEETNIFNTLVLYEKVIKNRVKNIRGAPSDIVPLDEKKKVEKYSKLYVDNNGYKVEYQYPELKNYGRVKEVPYTGLGTFCQEVRGYLANEIYIDVDMVNCHPVIILHEFIRMGIDTSVIAEYVNNRESFLESNEIDKGGFLSMINESAENAYHSEKVKKLHTQIYGVFYSTIRDLNKDVRTKPGLNTKGKFIAAYLQSIEFNMLSAIYELLKLKGACVDVLMHDGFFVRITENINKDIVNARFIENNFLTDFVHKKFKIDMKFKIKEHNLSLVDKLEDTTKNGYHQMKEDFQKNHCKIINKSFFIKECGSNFIVMTEKNLITSYKHLSFNQITEKGDFVEQPFITQWLCDCNMRMYDDIGCFPNLSKCPKSIFNTWIPFAMESIKEFTSKPDELVAILNHIKVLCNNEDEVYEYFSKWIGQMILCPEIKTICPTLISSEGAGKGTLINLLKKMLGQEKVFECTNPSRDVWGQFNSSMADTFLVNLNELSKKDSQDAEGRIKGLITDTQLIINGKGMSPYSLNSYHRFIITTNNYEPIATSQGDRRNFIIRSSDDKVGDKEYFDALYAMIEDPNVVKTCYEYFKSLPDLEKFHKLAVPRTEHHKSLILMSSSPIENWLEDVVRTTPNSLLDKSLIYEMSSVDMFKSFRKYCENNGIPNNTSSQALTTRIGLLKMGGIGTKKTKNCNLKTFDMKLLRAKYKVDSVDEPAQEECEF